MEYTYLARLLEEGKIDVLKKLLKDNLSFVNEKKLNYYTEAFSAKLEVSGRKLNNLAQEDVKCLPYLTPLPIPPEAINTITPMNLNTLINRAIVMTKDLELIELLLDNGADIYQNNLNFQNAITLSLSMASENKKYQPIANLIMSRVPLHISLKLNHQNKYYNKAMIYSAFCFESIAIDMLTQGVLPYEKTLENNIFLIACERNQMELIEFLIKHYPHHTLNLPKQETDVNHYFLIACYQKNDDLCNYLINHTLITDKTLEMTHFLDKTKEIEKIIAVIEEKKLLENMIPIENEAEIKRKKI